MGVGNVSATRSSNINRLLVFSASLALVGLLSGFVGPAAGQDSDPVTLCFYEGPNTSEHRLEVRSFEVQAPSDPPSPGDAVNASFVLTNVGDETFVLDEEQAAFVDAQAPDGPASFAQTTDPRELEPDQQTTVDGEITVEAGEWSLWPADLGVEGKEGPSEWHACALEVRSDDTTAPTVSTEIDRQSPVSENERLTLTGEATDEGGIEQIELYLDGESVASCSLSACQRLFEDLAVGEHTYRTTATDSDRERGRHRQLRLRRGGALRGAHCDRQSGPEAARRRRDHGTVDWGGQRPGRDPDGAPVPRQDRIEGVHPSPMRRGPGPLTRGTTQRPRGGSKRERRHGHLPHDRFHGHRGAGALDHAHLDTRSPDPGGREARDHPHDRARSQRLPGSPDRGRLGAGRLPVDALPDHALGLGAGSHLARAVLEDASGTAIADHTRPFAVNPTTPRQPIDDVKPPTIQVSTPPSR
jgi:hypothetical protein